MQSIASATTTALPDRRGFLSAIAGAGALSLPISPALAEAPGPIETMFAEHLRLERLLDAAAVRAMDAEKRYDEPQRPFWHPAFDEGGQQVVRQPSGGYRSCLAVDEENTALLREIIAKEHDPDPTEHLYRNAERADRARKTLKRIEDWQAEVRRRKDAGGLTEAEGAEERAAVAAIAQRDAILAIDATTIRELAFQAAVLCIDGRPGQCKRLLEQLTELAGVSSHSPV